jgi:thiamine biosynthesis lipoprotein
VASATVIHESCLMADGWATAMVVLGTKRGLEIAKREALEVILITRDGDSYREQSTRKD